MTEFNPKDALEQLNGLMARFTELQTTLDSRVSDYETSYAALADSFKQMKTERDVAVAALNAAAETAQSAPAATRSIAAWQAQVHELAVEKGWWTDVKTGQPVDATSRIPEALALIHSEISEALEDYRRDKPMVYTTDAGKPEGFAVELADAVIRIMDLCGALNIDLEAAMSTKHAFNKTRPYRHGNKRA